MGVKGPQVADLIRACERSAFHLEMRDSYMLRDPKFTAWRGGFRYDPADRASWWRPWLDVVVQALSCGVRIRRTRIVSEPLSEYMRFEYDITFTNVKIQSNRGFLVQDGKDITFDKVRIAVAVGDPLVLDNASVKWNGTQKTGSSGGPPDPFY